VLKTPLLPPSKTAGRDRDTSKDNTSGHHTGRKNSPSNKDRHQRIASPDSVAFDLGTQFMDLGSPKNLKNDNLTNDYNSVANQDNS
jgi:hypothetical protein